MILQILSVFLSVIPLFLVDASFVNPYPRYQAYHDGGDPGNALYLTDYIERGDVELVIIVFPFSLALLIISFRAPMWYQRLYSHIYMYSIVFCSTGTQFVNGGSSTNEHTKSRRLFNGEQRT